MTLVELFRAGLAESPGRVALISGKERLTFGEMDERARRIAGRLVDHADGPPGRIGVLAGATPAAFVGILGAMYAGAAAVPLNPYFPPRRTAAMATAAGVSVVLTDLPGEALSDLGYHLQPVMTGCSGGPGWAGTPELDDEAYLMFTSGSTGRPKGVPITHRNAAHFFDWATDRYPLTPDDVVAQTFEPTFDLFMFAMFTAWPAGAAVVCVPPPLLGRLPQIIEQSRISVWFSVPSTIRLLHRRGLLGPGTLAGVHTSLFCGEALTEEAAALWHRAAPQGVLDNLYGPTELTIACTVHRFLPGAEPATPNGVVPIGRPYPGLDYRLLPAAGETETETETGELCVTGPQMFRGYLDPADDDGRFAELAGCRWYRTGDLVRRLPDDGLAYLGRLDSTTKVRGYRVELLEVEHALRSLPAVDDCAVVSVDNNGETVLFAEYSGAPTGIAELMRGLAETLPDYMVPRMIRRVEALPLNANGKIDRAAVRARAAS
jgi:amino acid adenylation domain-containing protein